MWGSRMNELVFQPTLIRFLEELALNNNRDWFQANKPRYESAVLEPSQAFIRAFAPRLEQISPFTHPGSMFTWLQTSACWVSGCGVRILRR